MDGAAQCLRDIRDKSSNPGLNAKLVLVATRVDLRSNLDTADLAVSLETAIAFARENAFDAYVETSAAVNAGINGCFNLAWEMVMEQRREVERKCLLM